MGINTSQTRVMLFNSFSFAIFLPIVFVLYWIVPKKFQWVVLLISSYYFYMSWNVKYVVLILLATVFSYFAALLIERQEEKKMKKLYLFLLLIICMAVLFFFKYFDFLSVSISQAIGSFGVNYDPIMLNLILPVGISFYTFQTMSYVIDVYRGNVKAEKHLGKYAAFISFFPQLVAGPIERTGNLLEQIKKEKVFNYEKAAYGMGLMVWGFFKKIVIADTISVYVDKIYNNVYDYEGFVFFIATFLFTIQIYCDFSGYSDIAIGCAKLFSIDLMDNFRSPYFSTSIKEFWSRWHISLSTWFRDYLYIPLGGNRLGKIKNYRNLLITFLVSGLWHGANWTYVIWGGIHGGIQIIEKMVGQGKKEQRFKPVRWIFTFLIVMFAWIFFRAVNLGEAIYVLENMFAGISKPVEYVMIGFKDFNVSSLELIKTGFVLVLLFVYDYVSLKVDVIGKMRETNGLLRWSVYIVMILLIIFMMPLGEAASFIYFQF